MKNESLWRVNVLALLAILTLAGCKSIEYIPFETVRDRYHERHTADTLIVRDSVIIEHNGDTVRETQWHDRWRIHTVHDTVAACDTIREPYLVEVPAKLTAWQQVKVTLGGWAIFVLVIVALWRIISRRFFR